VGSLVRWVSTPLRLGLAVVVSFVVVAGGTIAVGELLSLAERSNGSTGFDTRITTWVVAHRQAWVTTVARDLSTLGSTVVLLPVVVVVGLVLIRRRRFLLASFLVAGWGGSIGLYTLGKSIVNRPRPPVALRLARVTDAAFPSGHATQSMATCVALVVVIVAVWPRARVVGWAVAGVLVAGIGWSRVYLAVHWTTDVVAGWLVASAWVILLLALTRSAPTVSTWRTTTTCRDGPG
jgi:undecaprenyl-diphosphatase